MNIIDKDRLAAVMRAPLLEGSHTSDDGGMCVMEAVAYVAGEPWSDAPLCACPVITEFVRSWNDDLDAEGRERLLKPLVPMLVNTRATRETELRRSALALDWLVRVYTPKFLDLIPELAVHADTLRGLGGLVSARAAAGAAGAAEAAARAAAWAAAWAAAGAAARAAALETTIAWLQDSAVDLVHRMIEEKQ